MKLFLSSKAIALRYIRKAAIACALMPLSIIACTQAEIEAWRAEQVSNSPEQLGDTPETWGNGQALNTEQSGLLLHLAWPQTYADMVGSFGYPDRRSANVDYYQLHDGRWIGVQYNANNQAIGLVP